jgi:hypothetical protein
MEAGKIPNEDINRAAQVEAEKQLIAEGIKPTQNQIDARAAVILATSMSSR